MLPLLLTLLGCQEPFGSDRHTLEGFRVAGLRVDKTDDTVLPSALLVVDGRLWTESPVDLAWAWVPERVDPAAWTGFADAVGPSPSLALPGPGQRLLLVAIAPDGTERRAVAEIPPDFAASGVGPLALDPGPQVEPAGTLLLSEDGPGETPLRWMGTSGTWFEQSTTSAEWTPARVVLEDGQVVESTDGEPGVASLIALRPLHGWRVVDVAVGPVPDGARVGDRWLAGALVGPQHVRLELDPDTPLGLRAADPTAQPAGALPPGVGTGPCGADGRFDPDDLVSTRCTVADYAGRTVAIEGSPWP